MMMGVLLAADAEGKAEHGNSRESRRSAQHAKTVSKSGIGVPISEVNGNSDRTAGVLNSGADDSRDSAQTRCCGSLVVRALALRLDRLHRLEESSNRPNGFERRLKRFRQVVGGWNCPGENHGLGSDAP
jgi:hypothetical protein